MNPEAFDLDFAVSKVDDDKHLVFGYAQVSKEAGADELITDRQGDIISPDELEKAAYDFVMHSRVGGDMHVEKGVSTMVESMVVTEDKLAGWATHDGALDPIRHEVLKATFPIGWWVGFKVTDEPTWELVKSGDRPMFSVHGKAKAREVV